MESTAQKAERLADEIRTVVDQIEIMSRASAEPGGINVTEWIGTINRSVANLARHTVRLAEIVRDNAVAADEQADPDGTIENR